MPDYVKVAKAKEIEAGAVKEVDANGNPIALFNIDGSFYAISNICTHAGAPLGRGWVEGDTVTCPLHGASFKIPTGEALGGPAGVDLTTYNVRVEGDDIEIEV